MMAAPPDEGQKLSASGSHDEDVEMNLPSPATPKLGKRKRDEDDLDDEDDTGDARGGKADDVNDDADYGVDGFDANEESLFVPDDEYHAPEDDEDDLDEDNANDMESDHEVDETADVPQITYSQSQETYPSCTYYDDDIPEIVERLTAIPQRVLDILSKHDCDRKHVETQRSKAEALLSVPDTTKLRIALLGDAGAGMLQIRRESYHC